MTYVQHFNHEAVQVKDYIDHAALQAAMNDLHSSSFKWEMSKKVPKTLSRLMEEA